MKKILFSLVLIGTFSQAFAIDLKLNATVKKSTLADNEINPFAADMLNATPAQMIRDNEFLKNNAAGKGNAMSLQDNRDGDGEPENLLPPGMYMPYEPEVVEPSYPQANENPYTNDSYILKLKKDPNALPSYLLEERGPDVPNCYRESCPVYVLVNKSSQRLHLYLYGNEVDSWLVSSGQAGEHETPNFDQRPDGPVFDKYSSKKYPGGDYAGFGNMPFVVFIKGGFALHGTTQGAFRNLGKKASHGCIRQHTDNGYIFNRLVKKYGLKNTWVRITN